MNKTNGKTTSVARIRKKLTPRQHRFVLAYDLSGNATQSAKDAGYSERSAANHGTRMVENDAIIECLAVLAFKREDEHRAIFATVVKRVNDMTVRAEKENPPNAVLAFKGLDQLAKLGRLYERDAHRPDVPSWTGVELDFGDGILRVVTGTGAETVTDANTIPRITSGDSHLRPNKQKNVA